MIEKDIHTITVVSGLPRSGTSLMMSMLFAGGLPLLVDDVRQADDDNPRGYFEFEPVKKLKTNHSWLPLAQGKAVKIVSALLLELPAEYRYRILFMQRSLKEILTSQRRMLNHRGEHDDKTGDAAMEAIFTRHLQHVEHWLSLQANMPVLYIDYAQLVHSPSVLVHNINMFVGGWLDEHKMASMVDPNLHHQRIDPPNGLDGIN